MLFLVNVASAENMKRKHPPSQILSTLGWPWNHCFHSSFKSHAALMTNKAGTFNALYTRCKGHEKNFLYKINRANSTTLLPTATLVTLRNLKQQKAQFKTMPFLTLKLKIQDIPEDIQEKALHIACFPSCVCSF